MSKDRMEWTGIEWGSANQKMGVFRALQLGDLLCAVPAFRALRAAFPKAEISLIGLPWAKKFADRFSHYLNHFIEFPGHPALPEQPARLGQAAHFIETVQAEQFDLILQMHGGGTVTNALVGWMGARVNAGFYLPGNPCPDPRTYLAYPEDQPEIWRGLNLLAHIGILPQGDELEFPIREEDRAGFQALAERYGLAPGTYAVLHPGASVAEKRWPPEAFAQVGAWLASEGIKVALTGVAGEHAITAAVADGIGAGAVNLAGETDLGTLAALLEGARLLLCNDTGVSHIAAALQIPSVVLFTGSEWSRWAPLDHELHRVISEARRRSPGEVIRAARLAMEVPQARLEAAAIERRSR